MTHEAIELHLWIDNNRQAYGRWVAACRSLERHQRRGDYDQDKALTLMEHVAKEGAKAYHAEHGTPGDKWFHLFPVEVRRIVARLLLDSYESSRTDDLPAWA